MPATYSTEERDYIIATVLDGLRLGTPLTVLCGAEGMPCDDTVRAWAEKDEALARDIARAREAGFDKIALEALAIADETSKDTVTSETGDRPNSEWITRSRLRVDTRLKLLAKWDPKRYGDATTVKHADADGEKIKMDDVSALTRLAALAAKLQNRTDDAADDPS